MSTPYPDHEDPDEIVAVGLTDTEPDPRHTPPASTPPDSTAIGGRAVNWRTLPDEAASKEWGALRDWVQWFTVRYEISESLVPDCWYRHARLVEELAALHTAHNASFDRTDTGYGPISWHERLTLALARMRNAYYGGCSRGHESHRPRTWPTDQEWDAWTDGAHAR
jgi:hypothetical protein